MNYCAINGLPGYDNTSRRTFIDAKVGGEAVKRTLFNYDEVGQLQSEVEGPGTNLNRTYAYDAMGNRQSQTRNEPGTTGAAAVQTSFARNPLNQITASTSTYSDAATPIEALAFPYFESERLAVLRGVAASSASSSKRI